MRSDEPAHARRRHTAAPRPGRVESPELRVEIASKLSAHERLVAMLAYSDGLSTREIAAVLEMPLARVAEVRSGLIERCRKSVAENSGRP